MIAARFARIPITAFVSGVSKQSFSKLRPGQRCVYSQLRNYASETRAARRTRARSLKEIAMAPAGSSAFNLGRGVVAGASLVGVGALCFYGLGMSSEVGAVDRSVLWPDEVKKRIRDTYMYFGGTIGLTAASAVAVSRTPALMNLMMRGSWLAIGASFVAMIGAGIVVRSLPYKEGFGAKQLAWVGYSSIMGAIVAPLCMLGGPLLVRAAWYTAGVVGGLSTVAMCAPSEKFLNMGGPLAIGLGLVFASSVGGMFLPPTTALGAGLYSVSIYGGLVLFGLLLLYDTQKVIKRAETYPTYTAQPYDPINGCLGIYLDTLNIFVRIATILTGGGGRKK